MGPTETVADEVAEKNERFTAFPVRQGDGGGRYSQAVVAAQREYYRDWAKRMQHALQVAKGRVRCP